MLFQVEKYKIKNILCFVILFFFKHLYVFMHFLFISDAKDASPKTIECTSDSESFIWTITTCPQSLSISKTYVIYSL
jgi:hypothetical protein